MKFYQILMANNILNGVSLNSLNIEDAKCILDFRRKVAPHISAFEQARKDAAEKLQPTFTDDMTADMRKALEEEWNAKVLEALTDELNREIDIEVKKTSPDAEALILVNNKVAMGELDVLRFLLG